MLQIVPVGQTKLRKSTVAVCLKLMTVSSAESSAVLERSELERSRFELNWCAQQGFGSQPFHEAPGNLWIKLAIAQLSTSGERDYLAKSWLWGSQIADTKKRYITTVLIRKTLDNKHNYWNVTKCYKKEKQPIISKKLSLFCNGFPRLKNSIQLTTPLKVGTVLDISLDISRISRTDIQ